MVSLAFCQIWEQRVTLLERFSKVKHPLVPIYLLKNRNFVTLMTCSTVGSMVFYSLNIIWPQQIGALFDSTPSEIGWISCTLTAGVIFGEFTGAFAVRYIGKIKYQLVTAVTFFVTFTGAMASIDSSRKAMAIAFSLLSSIGIGYMEVITLAGGPLMVDSKDIGLACGFQFAVRTGMSSLADSIYVTIVSSSLTQMTFNDADVILF